MTDDTTVEDVQDQEDVVDETSDTEVTQSVDTEETEVEPSQEEETEIDDTQEIVVPTRSPLQHIIARKNRQIERLKSSTTDEVDQDVELADDDPRKIAQEEAQRAVAPLLETLRSTRDQEELSALFSTEPEAKKYEKQIRAYMKNEAWAQIPASVIFHHLHFEKAASTGAKRKKVADFEAGQSKSAGSQRRPIRANNELTAEDINAMSDEEFKKFVQKQRRS